MSMDATAENNTVEARLDRIEDSVDSIKRAVVGAPDEGNLGLMGRMDSIERREREHERAIQSLNKRFDRMVYIALGSALGGGVTAGSIVATIARAFAG